MPTVHCTLSDVVASMLADRREWAPKFRSCAVTSQVPGTFAREAILKLPCTALIAPHESCVLVLEVTSAPARVAVYCPPAVTGWPPARRPYIGIETSP